MSTIKVLFVPESSNIDHLIIHLLGQSKERKFDIVTAVNKEDWIQLKHRKTIETVLVELDKDVVGILDKLKTLSDTFNESPIFIVAKNEDSKLSKTCLALGVQEFLIKDDLTAKSIEKALVYGLSRKEIELKLINANAGKDKLFSIISHDLRSPITSIMAITNFLETSIDELSKTDQLEMIQSLSSASQSALTLLDNLLNWSRLNSDKLTIKFENLILNSILTAQAELFKQQLFAKNLTLEIHGNINQMVFADKNMLETILRNLISNAIKFSFEGKKIYLSANGEKRFVKVSVADEGIGIPERFLEKLFTLGEKTNRIGTKNEPSAGLGLILCKEFVEKFGGKIWVESKENKGSVFYFSIPVQKV